MNALCPSAILFLAALAAAGCRESRATGETRNTAAPEAPVFQPAFHQALRFSSSTQGLETFRFLVPSGRAGERIRVILRSGDGALRIERATLGRAQPGQGLSGTPLPLTFDGAESAEAPARTRLVSDPVPWPVQFHEWLAVSFEAEGALAASSIDIFLDGRRAPGAHAASGQLPGAAPVHRMHGIATLEVESAWTRSFVALGDSITEGYREGGPGRPDDFQSSWPFLAEELLGLPVVNAGVSGQGVYDARAHLAAEVFPLQGVTDCLVALGTNDLGSGAENIEQSLAGLVGQLGPFCRVWIATLFPRESPNLAGERGQVNGWIRAQRGAMGVVDLDPRLGVPPGFDRWAPGLTTDGVHPTPAGSREIAAGFAGAVKP